MSLTHSIITDSEIEDKFHCFTLTKMLTCSFYNSNSNDNDNDGDDDNNKMLTMMVLYTWSLIAFYSKTLLKI